MASLILFILSKIKPERLIRFHHDWEIPFPPVWHQALQEEYVNNFEEIIVIGDVHGCYDELSELLQKSGGYSDKVLKIFVGDLINKGPKNREVLELVRSLPSTLSVRGNHDEVVLRVHYAALNPKNELADKNLWIKDLSVDDITYLESLPYTIHLPSLNSIIVHAGLIPGIPFERINPRDLVNMRKIVVRDYFWEGGIQTTNAPEGTLWGELWPGPEHVYFGHDAKRLLQRHRYATGLDTGCVYGKHLTCVFIKGPRKGLFMNVKAKQVYEAPKG